MNRHNVGWNIWGLVHDKQGAIMAKPLWAAEVTIHGDQAKVGENFLMRLDFASKEAAAAWAAGTATKLIELLGRLE